jgi:hypothetical protein
LFSVAAYLPSMSKLLYRNPSQAGAIADQLLKSPAAARTVLIDALVTSSALVETINATGGLVRDYKDAIVPAGDPEWLDLADVAQSAEAVLTHAGVREELLVNHDPV